MFTLLLLLTTAHVIIADGGEKAFDGRGCWYTKTGWKLPEDQMEVILGVTDVVECKKFCEGFNGDAPCYVLQVVNGVCSRNKKEGVDWSALARDQADSTQYQLGSCGDEQDVADKDDAADKGEAN